MAALRSARRRLGLAALVQIHHVIPLQWAGHDALAGYDMAGPRNLIFMPTRHGAERMRLRAGRLVHDGGHPAYNAYVRGRLDACDDAGDVHALVDELHARLRATRSDLPWR